MVLPHLNEAYNIAIYRTLSKLRATTENFLKTENHPAALHPMQESCDHSTNEVVKLIQNNKYMNMKASLIG